MDAINNKQVTSVASAKFEHISLMRIAQLWDQYCYQVTGILPENAKALEIYQLPGMQQDEGLLTKYKTTCII